MKLFVENMTCGGCAKGVTASLKTADEQATVNIDVAAKLVELETTLDQTAVLAVLEEDGWKADIR